VKYFLFLLLISCSSVKKDRKIQIIELPGFMANSGLSLVSEDEDTFVFWTHTDRGPNGTEYKAGLDVMRPFLEPGFHPYWTKFSINLKTKEVTILKKVTMDVTGLPNQPGDEIPVDINGKVIDRDKNGVDPESICFADKYAWMGEEYRPSILKLNLKGNVLERYQPGRALPPIITKRKMNRGFEGLTCYHDKVYAILQSPLPDDKNLVRLMEFDPSTETVRREFLYPLDSLNADKIGDLAVNIDGKFFVIEQNSEIGSQSVHKIYSFMLAGAYQLEKTLEADIVKEGFDFADKIEGLVVTDDYFIIVNDNDFGLENDKFNPERKSWIGFIAR
jgi:hypothetical protein